MNPSFKFWNVIAAIVGCLVSLPSSAAGADMGNLAGYGIVSAGSGSSLTINSGPITGDILVGDGTSVTTSGGGNGQIIGTISDDGTVPQSAFSALQFPPSSGQFVSVSPSFVSSAVTSAQQLSAYASSLVADQTFASISSAQSFAASSGTYVIDVSGNIHNAPLTFNGNANTFFIVNVGGVLSTNVGMTLNGISASQLLFNLTGSSGNIFSTSGGDVSYGTYLATNGGDFQFSNLDLTGALINTAGHIQFVSGSSMTSVPLTPVPEPQTYAMMLAGLGLLGFAARRRTRKTS